MRLWIDPNEFIICEFNTVDGSARVDVRITFVACDFVMNIGCISAPFPHREHDVSFSAFWPWGLLGYLTRDNAVRPVCVAFDASVPPESTNVGTHCLSTLSGHDAMCPRSLSRVKVLRIGHFPCGLISELMAELATLFEGIHPVSLRLHAGRDTVARWPCSWKFTWRWNFHQGVPVVSRIDFSCVLWRCRKLDG